MRGGSPAIRRLTRTPSFGGGAVVMATGVVSLCFHTTGPQWLSRSLCAVAAAVWAVLMASVVAGAFTDHRRWADEAGAASSLTLAAGTAVLGSRLAAAGDTGLATGLLAVEPCSGPSSCHRCSADGRRRPWARTCWCASYPRASPYWPHASRE